MRERAVSVRHGVGGEPLYLGRLGPLGTFLGFVFDALSVLEGSKTLSFDDGMMHEDVLAAALRRDETEALLIVEPLDLTGGHVSHSFPRKTCNGRYTRLGREGPSTVNCGTAGCSVE